ncbi:MAG: hypothetical protein AB7Q45_08565 [Planctomycetaceae bacterium]
MRKLLTLLPVLAACSVLSLASAAHAKGSLNNAIKEISEDIEVYLKDKQQLKISIGNFQGPPGNSSGRKLANLLKTELEARSIEVAPFSNWEVRGDFQIDTAAEFAQVAIQIHLVNSSGVEVSEFRKRAEIAVDQLEDVLAIAQPASFDGESAVVEQNVNAAGAEQAVAQATDTQPAGGNPPPANPSPNSTPANPNSNPRPATSNPPPTNPATPPTNPTTPPANSRPAGATVVQNPGSNVNPPPGGAPPVGTPPGGGTAAGIPTQTVSTELPGSQARDERLVESIRSGGFFQVNPTTIAASSSSPYHVQMKVRRRGASVFEPIDIREVGQGLAFCDLQEGDQYSIVVTNTAPHDVGLELMIDGINSLFFSEVPGFAQTGKWMIRGTNNNGGVPYSARIDGWYRNPESVYAFEISSEPNAVAATLGFPAKIGTITATFYGAWVGDDIHPLEARLLAERGVGRGAQIGTSKGPELGSQSTIVERKFGQFPLASVSVRYVNPDPPENLPIEPAAQ